MQGPPGFYRMHAIAASAFTLILDVFLFVEYSVLNWSVRPRVRAL